MKNRIVQVTSGKAFGGLGVVKLRNDDTGEESSYGKGQFDLLVCFVLMDLQKEIAALRAELTGQEGKS